MSRWAGGASDRSCCCSRVLPHFPLPAAHHPFPTTLATTSAAQDPRSFPGAAASSIESPSHPPPPRQCTARSRHAPPRRRCRCARATRSSPRWLSTSGAGYLPSAAVAGSRLRRLRCFWPSARPPRCLSRCQTFPSGTLATPLPTQCSSSPPPPRRRRSPACAGYLTLPRSGPCSRRVFTGTSYLTPSPSPRKAPRDLSAISRNSRRSPRTRGDLPELGGSVYRAILLGDLRAHSLPTAAVSRTYRSQYRRGSPHRPDTRRPAICLGLHRRAARRPLCRRLLLQRRGCHAAAPLGPRATGAAAGRPGGQRRPVARSVVVGRHRIGSACKVWRGLGLPGAFVPSLSPPAL